MIHVARQNLSPQDVVELATWQARVAGCPPYNLLIKTEWRRFSRQPVRVRVFDALGQQSEDKCIYCERNEVQTIDHYRPKLQFPATVFDWNNFNGACWTCNGNKGEPLGQWPLDPGFEPPAH